MNIKLDKKQLDRFSRQIILKDIGVLGQKKIFQSKVLIIEDVITTWKSSLECFKLIKKKKAKVVGYACLINRSNKKTLKIKKGKIISQIKLDVPTYSKKNLPNFLKKIPITKPGSRFLRWV